MENDFKRKGETKQKLDAVLNKLRDQQFQLIEEAFHELTLFHLEGVSDVRRREEIHFRFDADKETYKQQVQWIALAYFNVLFKQIHVNDFNLLLDVYQCVLGLFKRANLGQQSEQTHLEAISKIVFPEECEIS